MHSNIDNWSIPIPCPQCSKKFEKPLTWLEKNRQLTCPDCGNEFRVNDESFRAIREQVLKFEQEIRRISDSFKK